jgi:hypothetical protein
MIPAYAIKKMWSLSGNNRDEGLFFRSKIYVEDGSAALQNCGRHRLRKLDTPEIFVISFARSIDGGFSKI